MTTRAGRSGFHSGPSPLSLVRPGILAPLILVLGISLAGCDRGDDLPSPAAAWAGPSPFQDANATLSTGRETAVVRAAERVAPGVVAVHVLRTQQARSSDPFWDSFFFGPFRPPATARLVPSYGSGFVIDADGIVLTNDHVVRGAERILVTSQDGRDWEAELVGGDEATDVAVLRIEGNGLQPVPLGTTQDLRIGEWVIAFGNPFGNLLSNPEPTVTVGVTSAVGRHIVPFQDEGGFYLGMIQTDAAINPGNSGGPLANADGEVIGMNASIFSRSGGSEGMGFAIPIERVLRIARDIVEDGQVHRAWIGVQVEPEEADAFGRTRGVRVSRVADRSVADLAGIRPGDRLTEMNGVRLAAPLDFEAVLLDLRAGDPVSLLVNGATSATPMVAEELPSLQAERVRVFEDLEIVSLTPGIRTERNVESEAGALVTGISPQLQSILGLREGDVIVALNNRRVQRAEDVSGILSEFPPGARVRLYFERNRGIAAQDFVLGR